MIKQILTLTSLSFIFILGSCKKKDPVIVDPPTYTVPTTYNFTNVDYNNQKKLIAMADQLVATINLANSVPNTPVSAQKLKDMFNNTGGYFNDSVYTLNASGIKLSDYCPAAAKTDMLNYFDSIGLYSQSPNAASEGVYGVAVSVANKKYLLSPTGVFYSQVVKKTIMGIFSYEIANVYMQNVLGNSLDNSTVVTGSGTAMEHAWDQAFGFFGCPIDFPTTTTGLKYLAAYSNQVDPGLHSNAGIMNAFLKGRAAISAKDLTTAQAQANILITFMDRFTAACIVQEMKETDVNIEANDLVAAMNTLSETIGFVKGLKYNTSSNRIITNAQIAQLEALFDSSNPANPNLYNFVNPSMTIAQMKAKTDAIRQLIGTIYGFSAADLALL